MPRQLCQYQRSRSADLPAVPWRQPAKNCPGSSEVTLQLATAAATIVYAAQQRSIVQVIQLARQQGHLQQSSRLPARLDTTLLWRPSAPCSKAKGLLFKCALVSGPPAFSTTDSTLFWLPVCHGTQPYERVCLTLPSPPDGQSKVICKQYICVGQLYSICTMIIIQCYIIYHSILAVVDMPCIYYII